MYPNLKIEIFKRGLRQNSLARVLGLNEANLSKIINGYCEPSGSQRQMLARYFQVDENWLFEKFEANVDLKLSIPAHRKDEKDSEP